MRIRIKEEYRICDRCKEKINERWYEKSRLTKFKKKLFVSGISIDSEIDLCGICTEKFNRFMKKQIDDDEKTEYEQYYEDKKKNLERRG